MKRLALLLRVLACLALTAAPALAQWSTDALSLNRTSLAAVEVGGLALFAGGGNNPPQAFTYSDVVDVHDSASGTWSTAALSVARAELAGTVVGSLALFAGGTTSPTAVSDVVDIYDASLGLPSDPAAWSTTTLSQARAAPCATTVGTKAFFAGGVIQGSPLILSDRIDIYDASIGPPSDPAAWSTATLTHARAAIAAVGVGSQALFAGGYEGSGASGTALVEIYDDSSGLWSTSALSQARLLDNYASVGLGTRAYFAGGVTDVVSETRSNRVDIYDAQTGTWSTATLSSRRSGIGATAVGNQVLFAGGLINTLVHIASPVVDILDANTGNWLAPGALSRAHCYIDAITVGGKAMFAGGKLGSGNGSTDLVDVYEPCATLASASFRNAGSNPASYSCNAPVLGGSFDATVDLSLTGHTCARLFARSMAVDSTLAGGQHLLCGGTSLGSTPSVAGPLAHFSIAVPMDLAMCGLAVHTQALHMGGVSPFALSNAQDLVFGN